MIKNSNLLDIYSLLFLFPFGFYNFVKFKKLEWFHRAVINYFLFKLWYYGLLVAFMQFLRIISLFNPLNELIAKQLYEYLILWNIIER